MDKLISFATTKPDIKIRKDESFSDRLNNQYTVLFLILCTIIVSFQIHVGDPITCFSPQHLTENHEKYANSYCWVRNTYYLPLEDNIPRPGSLTEKQYIRYYQWTPFILLSMAALFWMPSIFWHSFNQKSGVDADSILGLAKNLRTSKDEKERQKNTSYMANQVDRFLMASSRIEKLKRRRNTSKYSAHLPRTSGLYLIMLSCGVKLLYICNIILQVYALNAIMGDFMGYGLHLLNSRGTASDTTWWKSDTVLFPRVTMCDFNIRRLGNVHRYTVQCTLPINLYNEKIFLFIWFWLVFVFATTVFDLIFWILRFCIPGDSKRYVENHIRAAHHMYTRITPREADDDLLQDLDEDQMTRFTSSYLKRDGVFLLRLIGHNSDRLVVSELIWNLWMKWKGIDDQENQVPLLPPPAPTPLTNSSPPKT